MRPIGSYPPPPAGHTLRRPRFASPATLMGDVLSTLGASHPLEAPTGRPPHKWTEQEHADCSAAMQRIVEDEAANPVGHLIWQLRQMKTPLAFDRAVVEQAADALAEVRDSKRNIGAWNRRVQPVEALSESDKEVALAQAVELAQYVEKQAKGGMREAAARFLSLSYAQDVAKRIRPASGACQ